MLTRNKQLATLERIRTASRPGVCKIYFLPVECIAGNFELFEEPGIVGSMPAISGKLSMAVFTNFSKEYIETFKQSDKGNYYEISVSGFIPYESKANHLLLSQMMYHEYILFVQMPSGLIKILGTKENPVKFAHSFNGGKQGATTPVGNTVSFQWDTDTKPLLLFRIQLLTPYLP